MTKKKRYAFIKMRDLSSHTAMISRTSIIFVKKIFLSGDASHHERANCKFPGWLTEHHTWHLLDHSKTYHFSSHNGTVRVTSNKDGVNVLEMRAVCNSILASSDGQIMISAHITVGW